MWTKMFKSNFINYLEDVDLRKYNTYRVGGSAKFLVNVNSVEELIKLMSFIKENNIDYKIIGNGSNLIVGEKYFFGIIIILKGLNKIVYHGTTVLCGAGVLMPKLAYDLANNNLSGFEFAAGIPGTVGGGCYMNAGAYNKDFSSCVVEVEVLNSDLEIVKYSNLDMNFSYRHSLIKDNNNIVLNVIFSFELGDKEEIIDLMKERKIRRESTQPLNYFSAGSVFKNVENEYVWKLIDECGLRGFKVGGASFSKKHPNFIVNEDGNSEDILKLIDIASSKVLEKFNIDLILEQEKFNC